jgi:hypothetical protein
MEVVAKRSKSERFSIVYELPDDFEGPSLDESSDLLPGISCCAICLKTIDLRACQECGRVVVCGACSHAESASCEVLKAVAAVEEMDDLDPLPWSVLEEKLQNNPSLGWTSIWNGETTSDMRFLAQMWVASEHFSCPLAVMSALKSASLRGRTLSNLKVVHLVGVEEELVHAEPWNWTLSSMKARECSIVGIGPDVAASLAFETHAVKYEDFLCQQCDVAPSLIVFVNPGFTVDEYSWTDALSVLKARFPSCPVVSMVHSKVRQAREKVFR